MKKIIILLSFLLYIPIVYSQTSIEKIKKELVMQNEKIETYSRKKMFPEIEKTCIELFTITDNYPEDIKKVFSNLKGQIFYTLASAQAAQNKKQKAIKSFEKAILNGWHDYSEAVKDINLNSIRKDKKFMELIKTLQKEYDYCYILKQSGAYNNSSNRNNLPKFTYLAPNDSNLVRIRQQFNLDSIAGSGNEVSKIKNLLTWVHNRIKHDGSSNNPELKNTIDVISLCDKENRGVNCRILAQILNECYLSMGFKSRYVTCMPKKYINDCHVINSVFSNTLNKWIWIDPTNNAYVMDEKGNLLSIDEVRERIIKEMPLTINEDANWNNKSKTTKEYYIDYYMAKNLYYLECISHTGYNTETNLKNKKDKTYISLYPSSAPEIISNKTNTTDNAAYFWQAPEQ